MTIRAIREMRSIERETITIIWPVFRSIVLVFGLMWADTGVLVKGVFLTKLR